MIPKEQLEAWEKIYQEVKHPYTEKNRSFCLGTLAILAGSPSAGHGVLFLRYPLS